MVKIPLFPLGLVLLPEMLLPLHIFEERYKLMVSECIAANMPFGIVWFDGQSIRSVGCTAQVAQVLHRYDDGRLDIMTRGARRFYVEKFIEEKPYMEGEVAFFDDEPEPHMDFKEAADTAFALIQELFSEGYVSENLDEASLSDLRRLSFAIAAMEGFTPAERQRFLEMTSSWERLRKSVEALSRLAERIKLTLKIQKIIGGNGQPPSGSLSTAFGETNRQG
jgi:Lon protease-like protein